MHPALLLLADSRLPTGGHAHSAGLEACVSRGLVRGPDGVAALLAARVPTTGLVIAAAAAAACRARTTVWEPWDAAVSARTPVAALRDVSRAQGRALLRTARATWPSPAYDPLGARPHQALALGVVVAAAGGAPADAAALAVHHLVGQICSGAVRLLGLDPLTLAGVHAGALAEGAATVTEAVFAGVAAAGADDPSLLPAATTPLSEVLAARHAQADGALFAS
ncbi:urease accessory protein UreF [Actinomycetospora straminea]|uniref:Urease accessory UreF family protein n=1 Tax=Actinomycetospora straminea TaxID=663607 RepID=A0ABP9DTF5_9PSEU|nr:urease accessory UreF family protein [Actinomycetospora straminea]MDD7935153.1 urease accessory UreF family protein [Actinomycetospora straminea]